MKKQLLVIALIFVSVSALAQKKIKSGIINATQSYYINNELMKKELQIIYFDDLKSSIESISTVSGGHTSLVYDIEQMKKLTLLKKSAKGKKYILEDLTLSDRYTKGFKVIKGTKTRNILGFNCKEVTVTLKKNGVELTINMFTTDRANLVLNNETKDLVNIVSDYPMYSEIIFKQNGVVSKIVTETVMLKEQNVSKEKFSLTPPKGYTKMY
ncbi:MAG: hypothetical protein ACPGUH_00410 [Winogradskyella sp.]